MARQSMSMPVAELLSEFRVPADAGAGQTVTGLADSPSQVQAFLDEYAFLMDLLPEIRSTLRDFFADAPVSLSVARDPDEVDRELLVVAVITDLSPGDALNRLGEFDRNWWLENLDRAQGRVCVDVEFG